MSSTPVIAPLWVYAPRSYQSPLFVPPIALLRMRGNYFRPYLRILTCAIEVLHKAPGKRTQHANTTYRNIVRHNMLRAFGHRVAPCCEVLGVVGSNLTIFKLEPTTPNMSQHIATCCAQQCCDMLCRHVAIVWPGLNNGNSTTITIGNTFSW